jgi:hypothetical protein
MLYLINSNIQCHFDKKIFLLKADVRYSYCCTLFFMESNYFQMTYTLYQGTRLGIALKEALEEMEVILKAFLSFLILFSVSRLKVLSSEIDLAERSS